MKRTQTHALSARIDANRSQTKRQQAIKGGSLSGEPESGPRWQPIAGAGFLVTIVIFLMYAYLHSRAVDPRIILATLSGFSAAASFAFFGESAVAEGKIPSIRDLPPATFKMGGGIAAFAIVFALVSCGPGQNLAITR